MEQELEGERQRGLQRILEQSASRLDIISQMVSQQHQMASNIMLSMHGKIESIIFSLGFDEAQEQNIMSAIDQGIEELGSLTQYSTDIECNFEDFVKDLEKIAGQTK